MTTDIKTLCNFLERTTGTVAMEHKDYRAMVFEACRLLREFDEQRKEQMNTEVSPMSKLIFSCERCDTHSTANEVLPCPKCDQPDMPPTQDMSDKVIKKSPAFLARLGAELAADESLDVDHSEIVESLAILGLNADKIFERIRDDLNRGLIKEAREHLNFVDVMLSQRQNTEVSHE